MSEHLPKFLAVHFDGDFLEHAAFVETEEEWAQLTCLVSPGDHWDPVLIPIETAAAGPNLLAACEACVRLKNLWCFQSEEPEHQGESEALGTMLSILQSAIAKAID